MKLAAKLYRLGIVVGAVLIASPFFGMLGTFYGMSRSFAVLGKNGVGDQQALSNNIGIVLNSTAIGLFLSPVGVGILVLSLHLRARARRLIPPPLPPHIGGI